jgi:hypothetical protein
VAPVTSFIASKERAQVTFMIRGENERKIIKVASGVVVFLLIRWKQFFCSA